MTNVIKPHHYIGANGTDVIGFAEAQFSKEELKGFYRINVMKYVTRYDRKNGIEDLKKALNYLNMLVELEEGKKDIFNTAEITKVAVRNAMEAKIDLSKIMDETSFEHKKQNDTFGSFMRCLSDISRKEQEASSKIATHYAGTNPLD